MQKLFVVQKTTEWTDQEKKTCHGLEDMHETDSERRD